MIPKMNLPYSFTGQSGKHIFIQNGQIQDTLNQLIFENRYITNIILVEILCLQDYIFTLLKYQKCMQILRSEILNEKLSRGIRTKTKYGKILSGS